MAVVKPFRGIRYNPPRVGDLRRVVSQPYDRINGDLQDRYYALSPYNVVRVIQGRAEPGDQPDRSDGPNVYTRARGYFRQWLDAGVLVREDAPAFYAYEQTFPVGDQLVTRLGMISAVGLTDFDEGVILPHEQTHRGPKEDRLRLLNALQTNTEQILILYPDLDNTVNTRLRRAMEGRAPDIDVVELWEDRVQQRVWAVTDPAILDAIQAALAPMRHLIIADGHHRYSTGLTYRDDQRAANPGAPANAAFNFVQATLVSMGDPGLIVLPTHREIRNFSTLSPLAILDRARDYFAVEPVADLATALALVNAHPTGHAYGFYGGPGVGFSILTLKEDVAVERLIASDHSREWKSLAVSLLHKVLLEQIAGVLVEGIEDQSMIRYHRDPAQAVQNVAQGQGNFAVFVSPTRMDQIKAIAGNGEIMPQKSTDFYPKVISGLTMLPVGPDERL